MKRLFLMMGLTTLLGAPAFAQEAGAKASAPKIGVEKQETQSPSKGLSTFSKASSFVGSVVKSAEGRPLGKVQDIVLDLDRGEVGYAVLALNESNGRMRIVAVPTRALKPADGHLVLNLSEPVLAAAEGLQDSDWPGTDAFAVGGPAHAESGTASSSAEKK